MAFFAAYERVLSSHPILTKSAMGTILAFTGDVVAQQLSPPEQGCDAGGGVDVVRLCAFSAFGGAWTGPVNHHWLGHLEHTSPIAKYGRLRGVAQKMVLQHAVFNPMVYVPAFLAYWGWVETLPRPGRAAAPLEGARGASGYDAATVAANVRAGWWPLLQNVWVCWIPFTATTFLLVPVRHQPVVMATVSLGWNTFLSIYANARHNYQ